MLESKPCLEAREQVRQFYSRYFAEQTGVESSSDFVAEDLSDMLEGRTDTVDYFTKSSELPRSFRVGACRVMSEQRLKFELLLFEEGSESFGQRSLTVQLSKDRKGWVIDSVSD